MKRMKRLTALVLSAAMVLSMSVSAFAEGETPVCGELEGCSETAHHVDCALYSEEEINSISNESYTWTVDGKKSASAIVYQDDGSKRIALEGHTFPDDVSNKCSFDITEGLGVEKDNNDNIIRVVAAADCEVGIYTMTYTPEEGTSYTLSVEVKSPSAEIYFVNNDYENINLLSDGGKKLTVEPGDEFKFQVRINDNKRKFGTDGTLTHDGDGKITLSMEDDNTLVVVNALTDTTEPITFTYTPKNGNVSYSFTLTIATPEPVVSWKTDSGAAIGDSYTIYKDATAYVAMYLDGTKISDTSATAASSNESIMSSKVMTDSGFIRITANAVGDTALTYTFNGKSYELPIKVIAVPTLYLQVNTDGDTWETIDAENPISLSVGGEAKKLRLLDADEQVIALTAENFRANGNVNLTYISGEYVTVSASGEADNAALVYVTDAGQIKWQNIFTVVGDIYQWMVNGEVVDGTYDATENNSFTLSLKLGNEPVTLNRDDVIVQSDDYRIEYNEDGSLTFTALSYNNSIRYTWDSSDSNSYTEFQCKNMNASGHFESSNDGHLSTYTFNVLADNDPEQYEPGRLDLMLRGANTSKIDMSKLSVYKLVNGEEGQPLGLDNDIIEVFDRENHADGITNWIAIFAKGNGSVRVKLETLTGKYASIDITVNTGESYVLCDADGDPLELEQGKSYEALNTTNYALKIRVSNEGQLGAEKKITNIELVECHETKGAATDEEALNCLNVGQVNNEWSIITKNATVGEYEMTIKVTVEGLDDALTFTVKYNVVRADSSSTYFYAEDYDNLQELLDAAAKATSSMRYIVLESGTYEREDIDGEDGDGILDLIIKYSDNSTDGKAENYHTHFGIKGEGNVVIKGSLNYENQTGWNPVVIENVTFEAPNANSGTAITATIVDDNDRDPIILQNVVIDGYNVGIDGAPHPDRSEGITIQNCYTGIALKGLQRDGSVYVYNNIDFVNNNTAIDLTGASGKFKMRDCNFSSNKENAIYIKNNSTCSVNAAFNTYASNDYNNLASAFDMKEEDFFSPYFRPTTTYATRSTAKTAYIDSTELNAGLVIDAAEANTNINTDNFAGNAVIVSIATVNDNGTNTTSSEYATWNFPASEELKSSIFNPLIEYELESNSQSVVESYDEITSYQPVSFMHIGDLPSTATVNLKATKTVTDTDGDGKLYLYKVVDGKLQMQYEVDENGNQVPQKVEVGNTTYIFTRDHCSDYIITDTFIEEEDEDGNDGDQGGSGDNTQGGNQGGTGDNTQGGNQGGTDDNTQNSGSVTSPSYDSSNNDDADSNNYIPVSEVKNKLNSTSKDTVTLNVESRDQLSAKVFEELAKHPEKTLVLKGDGYTLSIKGEDVVHKLSSSIFDADIRSSSPNRTKIRKLTGYDANIQYIHSDFHGMLPGEMTLRIKVDDSLKGKILNAYHYDEKLDALELVASGLKADAKGYAEFSIDHFSTYILTDSKLNVESSVSADKTNPSTGADDVAALAAAMAVVSVMGAAALNRKR